MTCLCVAAAAAVVAVIAAIYSTLAHRRISSMIARGESGLTRKAPWLTCPSCGREDVAAHTMAGGQCARCNLFRKDTHV